MHFTTFHAVTSFVAKVLFNVLQKLVINAVFEAFCKKSFSSRKYNAVDPGRGKTAANMYAYIPYENLQNKIFLFKILKNKEREETVTPVQYNSFKYKIFHLTATGKRIRTPAS